MTLKTVLIPIVKNVLRKYRRYLQRRDVALLSEGMLSNNVLVDAYWLSGDEQTAETKGYAVEALIYWIAARLRGHGEHSWTDYEWRLYNVVYYYYLQGGKVADLVERMGIGEAAFYKSVKRSTDVVAEILAREMNEQEDFFGRKRIAILRRYARLPSHLQQTLDQLAILQTPASLDLFDSQHIQKLRQHNLILAEQVMIHPEIQAIVAQQIELNTKERLHQAAADRCVAQQDYLAACFHYRSANQIERAVAVLVQHLRR